MSHLRNSPASAAELDFPTSLPPMLVKELRQGIRTKGFVAMFVGLQIIMILILLYSLGFDDTGVRSTFDRVNGFFWTLLGAVLLLLTPVRGLSALSTEIENKTIDLLMLTHLSSWRIVVGKWGSLMAQAMLLVLTMMPYGVVRYFFGSVNLLSDFRIITWMLGASAVLTAFTLWISGQAKVFRVLLPIILVVIGQSSLMGFYTASRMMTGTGTRSANPFLFSMNSSFTDMGIAAVCGFILLVLFLLLAARRLAPPAESYATALRIVPLVALGFAILLAAAGFKPAPLVLAFAILFLVCGVELSQNEAPMAVHWRPWLKRGAWGQMLGPLFLPGWQSAAFFTAAILGLFGLLGLSSDLRMIHTSWLNTLWWLALAWQAIVFPAILLGFAPRRSSLHLGGTGYFLIQMMFALLSLISLNSTTAATTNDLVRILSMLCRILPSSSFWTTTSSLAKQSIPMPDFLGQFMMLVALIMLVWIQSRPYWQLIRVTTLREGPPPEPLQIPRRR